MELLMAGNELPIPFHFTSCYSRLVFPVELEMERRKKKKTEPVLLASSRAMNIHPVTRETGQIKSGTSYTEINDSRDVISCCVFFFLIHTERKNV